MEDVIKLPTSLALMVATELRDKHSIDHWKKPMFDCKFTQDELSKIKSIHLENPTTGALEGVEHLPNLKNISIESIGSTEYKQAKNIASIGDKDIFSIEKCKNLTSLKIVNQANISEIDLSGLSKLFNVEISKNNNLEAIHGIDKLPELCSLTCYGNKDLQEIKGLNKAITQAPDLTELNLDVLLFPKAIDYRLNGSYNQETINKMDDMGNVRWMEALNSNTDPIKINNFQMQKMHNKACKILSDNVPHVSGTRDTIVAVERYLAENVTYDHESLKNNRTKTVEASGGARLVTGIRNGTNGAYNCIMENSCVCEGYTRGEQYLLALRGIKTHNVSCIGEADTLGMSKNDGSESKYTRYTMPKDGYHSIIRIDDYYNLYSDPCWNAGYYQSGDKSLPFSLRTKEEISKSHTLSFEEKNVENDHTPVERSKVYESLSNNKLFRNKKTSEISQQRNNINQQIRGQILGKDGRARG